MHLPSDKPRSAEAMVRRDEHKTFTWASWRQCGANIVGSVNTARGASEALVGNTLTSLGHIGMGSQLGPVKYSRPSFPALPSRRADIHKGLIAQLVRAYG